MTGDHCDLVGALEWIDPARLSYQEWVDVGMALHESGIACDEWESWSRRDPARYHEGECERKWRGFGAGVGDHVKSGTVARMAMGAGWSPTGPDAAIGWDDTITTTDATWADEGRPDEGIPERSDTEQLSEYLGALFDDDDIVGYVCGSWETPDGRKVPSKGHWDRNAGRLRQELSKAEDIGSVLGDYDASVGAWIRFNPLDGKSCGNANVTEFRYALVESDTLPYERQLGAIRSMHLPCAAIVDSAGKSVHAIVKVDAGNDYDLYRKRVEELYAFCRKKGFEPDTQNKNPSRLSRLPGAMRNGRVQTLISTNEGPESWDAWQEWVLESEDDLPDTTSLDSVWGHMPELSTPLIGTEERGILRHGHKMLVAGPSKAGKSFLLIELARAIATGGQWCGYPCSRGKVLYVNLEIDKASLLHRFRDIWTDNGNTNTDGIDNVDVWNLRGHAIPMDQLAPRLIHRARGKGYAAVIIDPIYKVITGDENSASEMADFTNQFDKVCDQLGTAVIYCHHHSKGAQGQKKSMDRASGSGVFARDPDAMLDLAPLDVPEEDSARMGTTTAWRITATLREFATPDPIDLYFRYPVHVVAGATDDIHHWKVEGEDAFGKQRRDATKAKREKADEDNRERRRLLHDAIAECASEGIPATRRNILEQIGEYDGKAVTEGQVKAWVSAKWSGLEESLIAGNGSAKVYSVSDDDDDNFA